MDETVELALIRAATQRMTDAGSSVKRGIALILCIPIVVIATFVFCGLFDSYLPLIFGAFYTLVGGIGGAILLLFGIGKHRLAARELRELCEVPQLPVARVVR